MNVNNTSSYVKINSNDLKVRIAEIIKHIKEFNKNIDENIREFLEIETKKYNNQKRFLFFKRTPLNIVEFKKMIITQCYNLDCYWKYNKLENQKYTLFTLSEIQDLISINGDEIFLNQKHVSEIVLLEQKFNLTYDKSEYRPQTDQLLKG